VSRPAAVLLGLIVALTAAPPAGAATPRPVELPAPELSLTVVPLSLGVARPPFEPPVPPPPPAPTVDVAAPPLPRFQSVAPKPLPSVRDPGGTACTFAFGRASSLADCGVHRALGDDLRGAREALEDSLARDPRGPFAATAYVWLGEVAFREGRYDEAERRYRSALTLGLPAELVPHAALGVGWVALRRGDLAEAQRALGQALAGVPPQPVALAARFLAGVTRLLAGRADDALPLWDAVAGGGPPPALAEELLFWRAVGQARLAQWDAALQGLDRFLNTVPASHPLRADAIVQSGWVALARGAPDEAVRRFLWAQSSSPRAEVLPQLRAGLVRAYLALGDPGRARDAARLLRADSARDPLLPPVLLLLADEAVRRNATADAVDAYRELLGLRQDAALTEYATYRLAEGVERLGGMAEAERHYRVLRETGRVEAVAQRAAYRLGLLLLRTQRPAEARGEGEALLRAGALPELREPVLLLTAEAAARGGDANRAVSLFRLALRDYPASAAAGWTRLLLGWALLGDGEPLTALREWQEAGLATNLDVAILAQLAVAEVALRQGLEAESLAALGALKTLAPGHALADTLTLDRGILLVRAKDYGGAVQELEPLVPRVTDPTRQAVLRRALGIARYQLGQFDAAEREFGWAAYWAPAEPSNSLGLGLAALAQNRLGEAERALGTARLAAAPEVAIPASYALILAADRRRDAALFRERVARFVDRYPTHPYAGALLYALVTQAVDRRDLDQADAWLTRLLRDQPGSEYVRDGLIVVADAAARERPALARQAYAALLARVKEADVRAEAWLGLAGAAMALGDGPETQRALEGFLAEAPADDPRAARALALLVQAHEMQGQRDKMLAATEAFLARFPNDPLAPGMQLTHGHLLLIAQQWSAAQQALEAARDTGEPPVAASAHFYLGELHRARGEHEAALVAYLGATYLYPDTVPWAARGLQGAIQSYLARQKPREASILLRKLLARPGVEPNLAQWARRALTQLGPITGEDPAQALRKGAAR
jgi:tetratricopeptide (TPR) repeat protein